MASISTASTLAGATGAGIASSLLVQRYTTAPHSPAITQAPATLHSNVANHSCTYQWYLNGNPISGATDSTFNFVQNGTYSVTATDLWGCANADSFVVNNVSVHEFSSENIIVYPMPARDNVTIQFAEVISHAIVSMYDMMGKEICKIPVRNIASAQIDVSDFARGIYMVSITFDSGKDYRLKLVIE